MDEGDGHVPPVLDFYLCIALNNQKSSACCTSTLTVTVMSVGLRMLPTPEAVLSSTPVSLTGHSCLHLHGKHVYEISPPSLVIMELE